MKKKTLHPIMIALLALFVLLQAFCLTHSALKLWRYIFRLEQRRRL